MADNEADSLEDGANKGAASGKVDTSANPDSEETHILPSEGKSEWAWGNAGPDMEDSDEIDYGHRVADVDTAPKKKKKKKKAKSKRGMNKPTGFEEYYVDIPVTPEEYNEEQALYSLSRPFTLRIETAIQRYVARRHFHSESKDLFDKYLTYGGIEAGPKMFSGGLDAHTLETKNAAEIAAMAATNFVGDDKGTEGGPNFVVDFDECVKGFTSSHLPMAFPTDNEKQVKYYIAIIRNFLNYLLHHEVCPEYKEQINAARKTCDLAEKELFACAEAAARLPGNFNKACSIIYGGFYRGTYIGDQEWIKGLDIGGGMSPEEARQTFKVGLAAQANDRIVNDFKAENRKKNAVVNSAIRTGLEVIEIIKADEDILDMYNSEAGNFQSLGKMRAKTWINPTLPPEDLTEEEEVARKPPRTVVYELWVEDRALDKCFVGMKIDATIRKTNFGVTYMDEITGVHCSYYRISPNDMMYEWKEPRPRKARKGYAGYESDTVGVAGSEIGDDGSGDDERPID